MREQPSAKHYRGIHEHMDAANYGFFVTLTKQQREHARLLKSRGIQLETPQDIEKILSLQEGRKLIHNDGSHTYIVHSANPESADHVWRDGLHFYGERPALRKSQQPYLASTAIMLAAPGEWAAEQRNVLYLAYRYRGYQHATPGSIKLVFAFPEPNPGTSLQENPFAGTFLDSAGPYVQHLETESGVGEYLIQTQNLVGAFDLEQGLYIPHTAPQHPDLAAVALNTTVNK